MRTLTAYKVVRRMERDRLVSLTPFSGWWCGYIPGLPTIPKVEGSLLFAFTDFDAAMGLAATLPWTEVWSALVEGDQLTGLVIPDRFYCDMNWFWEWKQGKRDYFPESWLEPASQNTLACTSVTLVERRWVNPIE